MFSGIGRSKLLLVLGVAVEALACESKAPAPAPTASAEEPAAAAPAPRVPGNIAVQAATYGGACGAPAGNHTTFVAQACNGKPQCSYNVSNAQGDPKPGCAKDFIVEYRCGNAPELSTVKHPAAENENYAIELACK
jgi:hypothetical protein